MHRMILILLMLGLLTQLACQPPAASSTTTTTPAATPTAAAATPPVAAPGAMKTTPSGLHYQDLILGTGRRPMTGQTVIVKYVGKLADGKIFQEGRFEFKLGETDVLPGVNLGVAGGEGIDAMKVDGKRLIILPPELGYGKAGSPPKIPPNATISFELELVKIQGGGLGF